MRSACQCHRAGRDGADVAAHVRRRAAVGPRHQVERHPARDAAVAPGQDASASRRFKDDPSLSDAADRDDRAWADSGAPQGNPADLPKPPQFAVEDVVDHRRARSRSSSSPIYTVPAKGLTGSAASTSTPASPRIAGSRRSRSGPASASACTTPSCTRSRTIKAGTEGVRCRSETGFKRRRHAADRICHRQPRRHLRRGHGAADEGRREDPVQHALSLDRRGNERSDRVGIKFYPKGYKPKTS